jgi:hypothetical protein
MGGGVHLGPLGTAATNRPIVPAPGDYDDGEISGMIGRGIQSTRRKPAPVPLCSPQTRHAARTRTRAAALGSQWLTAWAMARPHWHITIIVFVISFHSECPVSTVPRPHHNWMVNQRLQDGGSSILPTLQQLTIFSVAKSLDSLPYPVLCYYLTVRYL